MLMKYDVFAKIMAMYPTTPTSKLAKEFRVSTTIIKRMANGLGVYKTGRRHNKHKQDSLIVYNAITGEVCCQSKEKYYPRYSNNPIQLRARI